MALSYLKRKKIFERDNYTCRYCKRKAERIVECRSTQSGKMLITLYVDDDWRPFEIDHKKAKSKGGSNHINNLLTSCARCNNKKRDKKYTVFILEIKQ